MRQISEIIKGLRAAPHNLSQTEIFRRTGIPQSRISRWEAGGAAAGADDALKLLALEAELRKQPPENATPAVSDATESVASS